MAAYAANKVQSPANLDAYELVCTASETGVKAFVEAVNPVMYFVKSDFTEVHFIVDGHAHTAASLDAIADALVTVTTLKVAATIDVTVA